MRSRVSSALYLFPTSHLFSPSARSARVLSVGSLEDQVKIP